MSGRRQSRAAARTAATGLVSPSTRSAARGVARSGRIGGQIRAGPSRIWRRGHWRRGVKVAAATPGGGRGSVGFGGHGGGVPQIRANSVGPGWRLAAGSRGCGSGWRWRLATAAAAMVAVLWWMLTAEVVDGEEAANVIAAAVAGDDG
uniref:Uncharacterized protein n=1 Tax=Oryza rufipogon TaxID=4529 RepID=A0A0E0QMZ8_ORYRU